MMFDFEASLFWYKLVFTAELIVAEFIFVLHLKRRSRFVLRFCGSVAALFTLAFLLPIVYFNAFWTCTLFFIMFFASLCALKFCFNESWWNIMFCGLAAYTIQHIAFVAYESLGDLGSDLLGLDLSSSVYEKTSPTSDTASSIVGALIYFMSYAVTYLLAYFVYTDKIQPDDVSRLGRTRFVILAGIIIITDNIFSAITTYNDEINDMSLWLERGYNILTCLLALQLQFSQLTEKEILTRFNAVQHILNEEQKQYEIVKNNLSTINIKCHDMKHQLRAISQVGARLDNKELAEIESALSVYESVVKTGNDTLDLILTEKNLMHGDKKIQITCIADGTQLGFMSPNDMYSLLGNALDNAIESVSELEESKRNIGFFVKRKGNMVSIRVENYFEGERQMRDGLPQTTKQDHIYHGFGMLSMKTITEKYHGTMAVEIEDNVFNFNIMIPITVE